MSHTDMKEKLLDLRVRVDMIECYTLIVQNKSFLTQSKKDKFTKKGVYEDVLKEIHDFCKKRIEEISYFNPSENPSLTEQNEPFTDDEVRVLKQVAGKIVSSQQSDQHHSPLPPVPEPYEGENLSKTEHQVPPPPPRRGLRFAEKSNKKENIITPEETEGMALESFVGRTTRTVAHSSLTVGPDCVNSPGPYSLVKILGIEGDRADIQFVRGEHKGSINVNELAGFEYRG